MGEGWGEGKKAQIVTAQSIFTARLFGFGEMRLPFAMTQIASRHYAGYFGSLFMVLTMGIVAAPCIGPFVMGLLTWVAGLESAWLGFVVFFAESRPGVAPFCTGAVFLSAQAAAAQRGVDAVGTKNDGVGPGRHGRARDGHFAHWELGTSGFRGNLASLFRRVAGKCKANRQTVKALQANDPRAETKIRN